MGTIPAFVLGPRKTKKNLCRNGRLQDLPVTINEIKLSVNHSYLSLDFYLFILFNYIDFGDMFRHQVPSSGQYYVMTTYPYNAMHMLISLWDPTMFSLLQYWNYLTFYVIN
jgi:hypothetical protein